MWLRRQLVALFGLEERSAHAPDLVGWESLPDECVLQLHWPRTRAFARTLDRHGFRVLVIGRHPLDVLLSILHFSAREPATAHWLEGAGGNESSLAGADPLSEAFRAYATGPRAKALLGVSPQWWDHGLLALRYEDLVADPGRELERIVDAVGVAPALPPDQVAEAVTFESLQREASNGHFWQGDPGHWRKLLTPDVAAEVARPYSQLLRRLRYEVHPDPTLTADAARSRWQAKLAGEPDGFVG
jgi:Sulfotransferase domain